MWNPDTVAAFAAFQTDRQRLGAEDRDPAEVTSVGGAGRHNSSSS